MFENYFLSDVYYSLWRIFKHSKLSMGGMDVVDSESQFVSVDRFVSLPVGSLHHTSFSLDSGFSKVSSVPCPPYD